MYPTIEEMLKRIAACLVIAAISMTFCASAQQSVGLVLSGGGAKGIAHIGVIQALEDNNIPIDYIAGTSMGAIVGGLYAAGYTPDEMMALIESKGFSYWSTGVIDPSWEYYYAKDDPTPKLASINLNLRDSTANNNILPTSLISPLPMNYAFMELFAKYTAQCDGDFDRLFVPFRCVTSDVYSKHKIVCRSGSLGNAVRASMSFPIVFEPIEMDGVLVYDGGIYDNFPVDVMREDFAPDIMIGVDVSSPDKKPNPNNLMQQVEDMIIQKNDYSLPADEGIKLHVPVQQFGLLDFPACRQIYKIGYDCAMAMMDSIKERVTSRIPGEARSLRREVFKSKTPYVEFDSVKVTGGSPHQNAYIKYLFTKGNDESFGLAQARDAYYRAITPGKLRNLVPNALWNPSTGRFTLDLKADVKNNFAIGLGGYISSSTNSMLFMSTGYNTLSFNSLNTSLNVWIGQSYMASKVGAKINLRSAIPSYMMIYGVISRQKMYDSDRIFYNDGTTLVTDIQLFGRLSYGMAMGRNGKLALELGYGRLTNRFFDGMVVGKSSRDRLVHDLAQVRLHYENNTLNDILYPTQGHMIKATAIGVYGDRSFSPHNNDKLEVRTSGVKWIQLSAELEKYWSINRDFGIGIEANAMFSTQKTLDSYAATMVTLPSFHPTASTYNSFNSALRASKFMTLGIQPILKVSKMLQLRGEFHGFMPWRKLEAAKDENTGIFVSRYGRRLSDPEFFGEMSAVYALPFAHFTAYANYSTSPDARWNFGISFGLFFLAPQFMK